MQKLLIVCGAAVSAISWRNFLKGFTPMFTKTLKKMVSSLLAVKDRRLRWQGRYLRIRLW